MKKDFDSILDLITTLLDMMLSVAKGLKSLEKFSKRKSYPLQKPFNSR